MDEAGSSRKRQRVEPDESSDGDISKKLKSYLELMDAIQARFKRG